MFCLLPARRSAAEAAEAKRRVEAVPQPVVRLRHVRPVIGLQLFAVAPFILTPIPASDRIRCTFHQWKKTALVSNLLCSEPKLLPFSEAINPKGPAANSANSHEFLKVNPRKFVAKSLFRSQGRKLSFLLRRPLRTGRLIFLLAKIEIPFVD